MPYIVTNLILVLVFKVYICIAYWALLPFIPIHTVLHLNCIHRPVFSIGAERFLPFTIDECKKKSLHETNRKEQATPLLKRARRLHTNCLFFWRINHLFSKLLLKCIYAHQDKSPLTTPETFLPIREFQNFIHVYFADITPFLPLLMHLLPA